MFCRSVPDDGIINQSGDVRQIRNPRLCFRFGDGGKALEAVENYRQALLIFDAEPPSGETLDIAAKSYECNADAMILLAEKEPSKKKFHLSEVGKSYQKSLAAWGEIERKESPKSKDASKLDELKRKISDCDAALAKL